MSQSPMTGISVGRADDVERPLRAATHYRSITARADADVECLKRITAGQSEAHATFKSTPRFCCSLEDLQPP